MAPTVRPPDKEFVPSRFEINVAVHNMRKTIPCFSENLGRASYYEVIKVVQNISVRNILTAETCIKGKPLHIRLHCIKGGAITKRIASNGCTVSLFPSACRRPDQDLARRGSHYIMRFTAQAGYEQPRNPFGKPPA